ncbi:MAG: hypothetical protein ACI8WB_004541 [Phenylobacterium sp.]|jgi:hypothetical protein
MGKNNTTTERVIEFGATFLSYYNDRFSATTVDRVDDFIEHFEHKGLWGWKGKLGPSSKVPEAVSNRAVIVAKAQKYQLWHAHIGDPYFEDTWHGRYQVSDWVLHFQKISPNHIKLLELGYHNPMELPADILINE